MMSVIRSTEFEVKYHGNPLIIGISGSDNLNFFQHIAYSI